MGPKLTNTIIVVGLFCAGPASASHIIQCTIKARVVSLQNLERLDGAATFRAGTYGVHEDDFEQTVLLELLEVNDESTREPCPQAGRQVTLYVPPAQQGEYEPGSELLLKYRNMGDATGATIEWSVVREGGE